MSTDPTYRPGSVTQVVITYNMARYVTECLDSVLAQTLDDFELVIVDDASPDETQEVIRAYLDEAGLDAGIFNAHSRNVGLCATLNEVLPSITTEYVAFLSGDDWLEPERLEVERSELDRLGSDYGVAYSDMHRVDVDGNRLGETYFEHIAGYVGYRFSSLPEPRKPPSGDVFERLVWYHVVSAPTVLARTSALRSLGPYDEALDFEDWDIHLRLARVTKFAYIDAPLVNYRVTPNSLWDQVSAKQLEFNRQTRRIFRKHTDLTGTRGGMVVSKLGELAKEGYLLGETPSAVLDDLRLAVHSGGALTTKVYLLLAALRVPGAAVRRFVGIARAIKRRVYKFRIARPQP